MCFLFGFFFVCIFLFLFGYTPSHKVQRTHHPTISHPSTVIPKIMAAKSWLWFWKVLSSGKLTYQWSITIFNRKYIGLSPLPVRVTTRIITFLVGNPYKPSFPLLLGGGTTQEIHLQSGSIFQPAILVYRSVKRFAPFNVGESWEAELKQYESRSTNIERVTSMCYQYGWFQSFAFLKFVAMKIREKIQFALFSNGWLKHQV